MALPVSLLLACGALGSGEGRPQGLLSLAKCCLVFPVSAIVTSHQGTLGNGLPSHLGMKWNPN